jgi:FkbM family methyltransferase
MAMERPLPFQHDGHRYHINAEPAARYHLRESISKLQRLVDVVEAPPHVVLDVGANCGLFAAFLLRRFPQATVHCFEPTNELLPLIHSNCQHKAVVNASCVGELDGTCTLYVNDASQQTNSTLVDAVKPFAADRSISKRDVPQVSLDTYCKDNGIERVDVLKVDVQGAEGGVLRGARRILPHVETLLIESSWLDIGSVLHFVPFAKTYGFDHVAVVNSVYAGADLALSRNELEHLKSGIPRYRLSDAESSTPWI